MRSHAPHIFRVSQSSTDLLKALIVFYQDEQYWVRRTRMVMRTDLSDGVPRKEFFLTTTPMDTSPDAGTAHSDTVKSQPEPSGHDPGGSDSSTSSQGSMDVDDIVEGANQFYRAQAEAESRPRAHSRARPPHAPPPELTSRILDTFADLMDARIESCQRMSRLVEMRQF